MFENSDLGAIVFGVLAAGFVLLMFLALRKVFGGVSPSDALDADDSKPLIDETADAELALDSHPEAPEAEAEPEAKAEPLSPHQADSLETPEQESDEAAIKRGLEKTRKGFMSRMRGALFGGRAIDEDLIDELEEILITSDIGVHTSGRLLEGIRKDLDRKTLQDPEAVQAQLKAKISEILTVEYTPKINPNGPTVIMVIGVNGVGKTTTIGKIAARLHSEGKKLILGAGDTFRAAAVEQLGIWADRSGATLVRGPDNSDPSSVIFSAIEKARADSVDYCINDTAGRLHNKVNLMQELKKIRRVMDKALPGAPHETLLVIDATTGQNGITQAKQFAEAVNIDAIALTKLDGTAKGGVIVAICDAMSVPVRYIGVGEGVDDLRDFNPDDFVEALFAAE